MIETRTLADLIRQRRFELGLTQEQLADRIGLGTRQADVSRLERGRVGLPRRERLERIANALELPLGELLVRSGWAGADMLDRPAADRSANGRAGAPPNEPTVVARTHSALPATDRSAAHVVRSARLRAAIERSHEIRQQSVEVRLRAYSVYELYVQGWRRTKQVHRGQPPPSTLYDA